MTISDNTKMNLTLGTALVAAIAIVGFAFNTGRTVERLEARIAAVEARAEWDAADVNALATKMDTLSDNLNTTNNNVTRLSAQMESLLQQRGSTTQFIPADTTVIVQSPPAEEDEEDEPESEPEPQPALINFLQAAPCRPLGLFCNQ